MERRIELMPFEPRAEAIVKEHGENISTLLQSIDDLGDSEVYLSLYGLKIVPDEEVLKMVAIIVCFTNTLPIPVESISDDYGDDGVPIPIEPIGEVA